jgi:hypothetical protein
MIFLLTYDFRDFTQYLETYFLILYVLCHITSFLMPSNSSSFPQAIRDYVYLSYH